MPDCDVTAIISDDQVTAHLEEGLSVFLPTEVIEAIIEQVPIIVETSDEVLIETNQPKFIIEASLLPPDYLDGGEVFIFKRGQTRILGELILAESSEIILQHKASVILE